MTELVKKVKSNVSFVNNCIIVYIKPNWLSLGLPSSCNLFTVVNCNIEIMG